MNLGISLTATRDGLKVIPTHSPRSKTSKVSSARQEMGRYRKELGPFEKDEANPLGLGSRCVQLPKGEPCVFPGHFGNGKLFGQLCISMFERTILTG